MLFFLIIVEDEMFVCGLEYGLEDLGSKEEGVRKTSNGNQVVQHQPDAR